MSVFALSSKKICHFFVSDTKGFLTFGRQTSQFFNFRPWSVLRRFDPLATRILLRMSMKWAKKVDDPRFFFEFYIRILKLICCRSKKITGILESVSSKKRFYSSQVNPKDFKRCNLDINGNEVRVKMDDSMHVESHFTPSILSIGFDSCDRRYTYP